MASKKRSPSFEIPDAVRQAGQAGWVYRTGDIPARPKTTRPSAPLPRPARDRLTPVADLLVAPGHAMAEPPEIAVPAAAAAGGAVEERTAAPAASPESNTQGPASGAATAGPELILQSEVTAEQPSAPPARAGARTLAGLIVSLSVQAIVALFVVPLYLLSGGCLAGSPDVK